MSERALPTRPRIRSAVLSVLIAGALTGGWFTPAAAAPLVEDPGGTIEVADQALAGEPQLRLDGPMVVVVVEAQPDARTEYWVETSVGERIAVTGDLAGVTTGSTFSGTVAIPGEVTARVSDRFAQRLAGSATDPVTADSAAGRQVVGLVADASVPLRVVDATITSSVTAAASPPAHTINVAIPNFTAGFTDTELNGLISGLNAFWTSQSNGKITSVARVGAIVRYDATADDCDIYGIWDEAAARFGRSSNYYWFSTQSQHLLVITDYCGAGVASVGGPGEQGGVILMNPEGLVDLHTAAHEFGHNLGLGHSNAHRCEDPATVEGTGEWDADQCYDDEYADLYDVMGGGFTFTLGAATYTTDKLAALNATHKRTLGYYPTGDLATVTSTTTRVLQAASATSGLRALDVRDPFTGESYVVEYRSGTGLDANAFYAANLSDEFYQSLGLKTGVRVLGSRQWNGVDDSSFAVQQLKPAGDAYRRLALTTGGTFTSPLQGIVIRVDSRTATTATVTVQFPPKPTVDRIEGADRYQVAVNISKVAFPEPMDAEVVYIATGNNYPDALSAAPAAVREGAPLLLTSPGTLPAAVVSEIERLDPKKIVVVGGVNSVTPAVFDALQDIVLSAPQEVIRLDGADRYAASLAVNRYAFGGDIVGPPTTTAYVVTGSNFPDALSAGAAGGSFDAPVILVYGPGATAGEPVKQLLTDLGVTAVKIGGGVNSVSNAVQASLAAPGRTVERFAGADRFVASQNINLDAFDPTTDRVYLATGLNYPDALAGAALAGKGNSPLYVVPSSCVPRGVLIEIRRLGATKLTLLGGPNSLNASVFNLTPCGF